MSGAAFCCRARVFRTLGASMPTFSPIWRRSTFAGGCSWRAVACGGPRGRVYHLGGGTLQTDSPSKVFYNHRNNLAMLYKCSSSGQRLLVAVLRPALDLLAALSYLAQGRADNFRAVFRAWRDFSSGIRRWRRRSGGQFSRRAQVRSPTYLSRLDRCVTCWAAARSGG